jgi:hypothetical protein
MANNIAILYQRKKMWILLIAFYCQTGVSSQQLNFATYKECQNAQIIIEKKYPGTFAEMVKAKCVCIEVDQ